MATCNAQIYLSLENNDLSGIDKYSGSYDQDDLGVTQIPTETIKLLNNFTLLSVFTFLASCPKDWKLNAKHLAKHFGCNKDKIYGALESLINIGLLTRTQIRIQGKFVRYHYRLHLRQNVYYTPCLEKPDPVKPDPVFPDTYKTENKQNKENMCEGAEPTAPTNNLKNLKKEQAEKAALEDEQIRILFAIKFSGLDVTLEKLFKDCQDHREQKGLWATKSQFLKWVKNERVENYSKKNKVVDTTKPTQIDFCEHRAGIKGYEWVGEWIKEQEELNRNKTNAP